jgi:isopentenyl phosphate kinase
MTAMINIDSVFSNLHFLKLGGSLITDKTQPRTPRRDVIARLAKEIRWAKDQVPNLTLLLGHGSGSFGHVPAEKYRTRQGVRSPEDWMGFTEVWFDASSLNRILIEALHEIKLPVISLPVSSAATTSEGLITSWDLSPILNALKVGLMPVVYGDVTFDTKRGGTILSTEDIFNYLARYLKPKRILLAGMDSAVYEDYPDCTKPITEITPADWEQIAPSIRGSSAKDVTGGMASKVACMVELTAEIPGICAQIFSGDHPGNLSAALCGRLLGTRIINSP